MTMKVRYTTINGEVIAENRNGVYKSYVPDPLGSTVALLDNTQTQTDTFSYWPYGEVNVRTGSTPTPFQFVGTSGYFRDSSSRTYVRARYFDASVGQWLTQDPIGSTGGNLNSYWYAHNNPIRFTDPSGLLPQCVLECLLGGPVLCAICLALACRARRRATEVKCSELENRGFYYNSVRAALDGEGLTGCKQRKEDKKTSCEMGGVHYGYQCDDGYHSVLCCKCINDKGNEAQRCGVDLGGNIAFA